MQASMDCTQRNGTISVATDNQTSIRAVADSVMVTSKYNCSIIFYNLKTNIQTFDNYLQNMRMKNQIAMKRMIMFGICKQIALDHYNMCVELKVRLLL